MWIFISSLYPLNHILAYYNKQILSILNWLLAKQGKRICGCSLLFISIESGWKKWTSSWKHKDSILATDFFNPCQLSNLNTCFNNLTFPYKIFIYRTSVLPQIQQFEDIFQAKLNEKGSYKLNISVMRLRMEELQQFDSKAQEIMVIKQL